MAINREKVLEAAQKFVEKKKYDKAVQEYEKIIQEDPNDARTLLKIGDLQSKMEAYANAISTYERVGKFYATQGFALKAIAVYKQIREIVAKHVPQLEERYGHITPKLAELYQQLGLTSDALAALDEVATRLQRQQRDQEAIDVFRKIVELDPTNPLPHLRLAEALSRIQDAETAVLEFGTAGSLLVKLGRRDDAIKVFERLLHHKPDAGNARICAELYLERGHPQDGMQALAKLQLCFQADPKNLDTLALLARAFGAIGQAAKGIEVQKEMARLAKEQGKVDVFKTLLDKLLKLAPNDEGVRALAASGANPSMPASGEPEIRNADGPDDVSYENVDSELEAEPEEAFPLQSDRPPPQSAPRLDSAPARPAGTARNDYDDAPEVDAAEESMELVAEDEISEATNVREAIAQVLTDAASFRRVRLYAKAISTLRGGLELDPGSREVRETLRDALIETRQYAAAAAEMVTLASQQIDSGDVESAARTLYDALNVEADNPRAIEMLQGLGYELPGGAADGEPTELASPRAEEAQAGAPRFNSEPLPSYELEDAEQSQGDSTAENQRGFGRVEEPFDAPLPSFPLDGGPESEASFDLVQGRSNPPPAQNDAGESDAYAATGGREAAGRTPGELEEALEEADFFASRGLYDDARTILTEQLSIHPGHVLLQERMTELDSQEQSARGGSGTRQVPRDNIAVDRSFDIAASLDAIENLDTATSMPQGFGEADKQIDVEEVFAKFKEGVAKQVSADDAQSHYDLGVAYKEMGLIEDAINEFGVAARDPKRECVCLSMVGMIQMERGKVAEALDAFLRGLHAPNKTPEQETVLCFEIGVAYETIKKTKDALTYYQKVVRRDPSYRDVQERIRKLSKSDAKPAPRAAAVGADDEFDRAFDEIIGGGKLP